MELSELAKYAREKYHIEEQHKWPDRPGVSVLCDPDSGKWLALLMQQWDTDTGRMVQRCDIRCGQTSLMIWKYDCVRRPFRMKGDKWAGVVMEDCTDQHIVFELFDSAFSLLRSRGYTIVLDYAPAPETVTSKSPWGGSLLPASSGSFFDSSDGASFKSSFDSSYEYARPDSIPAKIFEMISLYEYGSESFGRKCHNFYRQGKFMEDFEDEASMTVSCRRYFTTYHDLNITQLRAYFTWRKYVRRGIFNPIPTSLAYLYLYELLSGIGAGSPEDSLQKMEDFERGFLDSGIGDSAMKENLHRWMFEFAVINGLPSEIARQYEKPEDLTLDRSLSALKNPQAQTDEALFEALSQLSRKKIGQSPVLSKDPQRGKRLFARLWRIACAEYAKGGRNLFAECFGRRRVLSWKPLSNAVYWRESRPADTEWEPDSCRTYRCRDGKWKVSCYDPSAFDKEKLDALLHEADRYFRRYFKTGRYLRAKEEEAWATPFAEKAAREEIRAQERAKHPEITIHFSSLDRIRQDAAVTRDSLLTEEETAEIAETAEAEPAAEPVCRGRQSQESKNVTILRKLLNGESADDYIKEHHLLASVVADEINEAMFDEIGDSVLECDGRTVTVVDDYREDLAKLLNRGTDID